MPEISDLLGVRRHIVTRKTALTVTPGNVVRLFSEEEAVHLASQWIATFGGGFRDLKRE